MRLHDEITRTATGTTYAAYIWSQQTASPEALPAHPDSAPGVVFALDDQLRCIIQSDIQLGANEIVQWKGSDYQVSRVARRYRRGKFHHLTFTMIRD